MINKNANDFDSYIYFLKWLIIDKQLGDYDENSKQWIITDNAKIHIYEDSKLVKRIKIKLITILTYSLSLNPAKKLISIIKNKLKKTFFENRLVIKFKNLICHYCQQIELMDCRLSKGLYSSVHNIGDLSNIINSITLAS